MLTALVVIGFVVAVMTLSLTWWYEVYRVPELNAEQDKADRIQAEQASETSYKYDTRELKALQKSGYFLLNPGDEMPDWPEEAA